MDYRSILFRAETSPNDDDESEMPPEVDDMWSKFASGLYLAHDGSEESQEQAYEEMRSDLEAAYSAVDWELINDMCRNPGAWATKCDDEALDDIELGGSRLGGVPDLPIDFEWPRFQGYIVPLIAQLNLADVEHTAGLLPNNGWLCVFGLSGMHESIVPFVVFHLECSVAELKRCDRPPNDDVWVPAKTLVEGFPLNSTIPLAVASSAMVQSDEEIHAWLLTKEVVGYGDVFKVAEGDGLVGNDWIILFGMKTTFPDSGRFEEGEFHLLIREEDLRREDFSNLHPFLIS